ncbi:DUF3008 family protein [Burkholderia contaminans]|uniref:DUF3008 family protein n=2 Tax=Burkholderia contaminans TaxID=488447 RepID=UPI002D7E6249|nr:DUF3008 family protein [Burkholderia contaminans]
MMAARKSASRARADRRVDACAHDRRATMPAKAKAPARRRTAGAALPAGRGKTKMQDLMPPAKSTARSMSASKRVKTVSTPKRGKPEHKHDA